MKGPGDRRRHLPWLVVASFAMLPGTGLAHTRERPVPETLWQSWNLDVPVLATLVVATWLYLRGVNALWSRGGTGVGIARWQVAAYASGILAMVVAIISPLDALGAALFSAHMGQHMLLMLVAPLLLAAGNPMLATIWAIPARWRHRLLRTWRANRLLGASGYLLGQPLVVFSLFALGLWVWHLPRLYDLALRSDLVHQLEHVTFFGISFVMWLCVLETGQRHGMSHPLAVLLLFAATIQSGALGAILTFASRPLYTSHDPYVAAWGLTSLEDQQLAGVIMWIPMGTWLAFAAFVVLGLWIRAAGRRGQQVSRPPLRTPPANPSLVRAHERSVHEKATALANR